MKEMKAISIKQPWCSLIAHGIKDIENRTWAYPKKYLGQRVLIHASKRRRWVEPTSIFTREQFDAIRDDKRFIQGSNTNPQLIDSAIIGSVEIVDCVINHPSIWAEKTENYTVGMNPKLHEEIEGKKVVYNWVLANPILFSEPIPAKGKLSFWDYPNIHSEDDICLCQIAVDEKNQVMDLCGEYRCWYCGGKWSK